MVKSRSRRKKPFFECPYCFLDFDNYEEYDLHLALAHDEDNMLLDEDDYYYYY